MPVHHRLPRAGVDRFDSAQPALALLMLLMSSPPRHETIVITLDLDRLGVGIVVVDGTEQPDAVLEIVECLAGASRVQRPIGGLVVATVRPTTPAVADAGDETDADVERWMEISAIAEQHGIELVEWFVCEQARDVERGWEVRCPRDRLGESPRW